MNDSERYWAGYCLRKAQDLGYAPRELSLHQINGATAWFCKAEPTRQDQLRSFLLETLCTGLTTKDRRIAFRCILQANKYQGQLEGYNYPDAVRALRDKVESILHLTT